MGCFDQFPRTFFTLLLNALKDFGNVCRRQRACLAVFEGRNEMICQGCGGFHCIITSLACQRLKLLEKTLVSLRMILFSD